jgi:hypothetical protein
MPEKRQRNDRRSKYRPRSEAHKQRRRELWEARAQDRGLTSRLSEEKALKVRFDELESALLDVGRGGVHSRRNTVPLEQITDDDQRFHVLKARVERLEALWSINQRKRETRGKIIIGGALLAEAADQMTEGESELLQRLVDIVDRRVERVRDRLTVRELFGDVPLPLRQGGGVEEGVDEALAATGEVLPDFDAMALASAMADDPDDALLPSDIDADYADLDVSWGATG